MASGIQVLTHIDAEHTGPSLLIHTQTGKRYIIGQLSEGFQRSLNDNRMKSSKVEEIMLTGQIKWDSFAGLPGFLLTATADHKTPGVNIYSGPEECSRLQSAIRSWKSFIFHSAVKWGESSNGKVMSQFQDDSLIAKGVDITGNYGDTPSGCFIIQFLPSRGKFLVDKAKKLGVPPGEMFRQLTNGESVVTANGNTVHPEDVMEAPKPPPRVLVVDVPSQNYVDSLTTEHDWAQAIPSLGKRRKNNEGNAKTTEAYSYRVNVVYHFLGESVDPFGLQYMDWIQSFGADTLHFISHPDYADNSIGLEAAANLNYNLRQIMPNHFRHLYTSKAKKEFPSTWDNVFNLTEMDAVELKPSVKRFSDLAKQSSKEWNADVETTSGTGTCTGTGTDPKAHVITLGTGSSQPGKYRNVISTLVTWNHKSVMLDCGEGTLGSLKRLYPSKECDQLVKNLDILYISHMHADHHLGSVSVILKWLELNEQEPHKKLYIFGPFLMYKFLQEWSHIEPALDLDRVRFSDLENYLLPEARRFKKGNVGSGPDSALSRLSSEELQNLGLVQVLTCPAIHCEYSYSGSLEYDGFKVSYSGDTRPNELFGMKVGYDSDLLIHEATHEDDLVQDAIEKKHSTIGEAIQVGMKMNAKNIILTHFSQRYPKLPHINREHYDMNVAIAFDGMHIKLEDIAAQKDKFGELRQLFEAVDESKE